MSRQEGSFDNIFAGRELQHSLRSHAHVYISRMFGVKTACGASRTDLAFAPKLSAPKPHENTRPIRSSAMLWQRAAAISTMSILASCVCHRDSDEAASFVLKLTRLGRVSPNPQQNTSFTGWSPEPLSTPRVMTMVLRADAETSAYGQYQKTRAHHRVQRERVTYG